MDKNEAIINTLDHISWSVGFKALLLVAIGYVLAKLIRRVLFKATLRHFQEKNSRRLSGAAFYLIFIAFLLSGLSQLGFQLSMLLGITGVLTLGISFAAQTAISNLISGLFILGEKPFDVGDNIRIDKAEGRVHAINMLSLKLRTPQNTLIRIPNEKLLKSDVENFSHFPVRRIDMDVKVSHEQLEPLQRCLLDFCKNDDCFMKTPPPALRVLAFNEKTIQVQFSMWCKQVAFFACLESLPVKIKTLLATHKIDIFDEMTFTKDML